MPLREVGASDARELKDIADAIARSHKVLVVTGAGISTSCGIPDFRSKDGLYNMIPDQCLPTPPASQPCTPSRKRKASEIERAETTPSKRQAIDTDDEEVPSTQSSTSSRASRRSSSSVTSRMSGQDLFHARVFQRADTTQVFNQFLAGFKQKLKDEVKQTSKTHKFIRSLRDGGRLMRCYTQNIDGLEEREGLCVDLARGKGNKRRFMKKHFESPRPESIQDTDYDGGCEVVQLHGELTKLRCTVCSAEEEWTEEASEILLEGAAPKCNSCNEKSEIRQATGKRGLTIGALRPNIVLYGEEHPQNTLLSPLVPYDIASGPEVLIIMGTSLKVFGMQKIIRDFAKAIHSKKNGRVIFVNRTRPAESVWEGVIDDYVEMDCDDWVDDLKSRRPGLWLRQGELDLKETKPSMQKRKKEFCDSESDRETVMATSKKVKIRQNAHISVDIPPRNRSPQKSKSIPSPSSSSDTENSAQATKWRKPTKAQTPQTPSRRQNKLKPSPPFSPLTPPVSPLTPHTRPISPITPTPSLISPSTPSSHRSRYQTQAKTPSRLRLHQDIAADDDEEQGDANDEDTIELNISANILSPKRSLNSRLVAAHTDGIIDNDENNVRVTDTDTDTGSGKVTDENITTNTAPAVKGNRTLIGRLKSMIPSR